MREIPISRGLVTLVDDEDYETATAFPWCALKAPHTFYAMHREGTRAHQVAVYLHRLLLGASKGEEVDHRNGDGLDNRRENLRLCTHTENLRNIRVQSRRGYKGVRWSKRLQLWTSEITVNQRCVYLGSFRDIHSAARAYNDAALEHFKEFASLNVICPENSR